VDGALAKGLQTAALTFAYNYYLNSV